MSSSALKTSLIDSLPNNMERTMDNFLEAIQKESDLYNKVVIEKSKLKQANRDLRKGIILTEQRNVIINIVRLRIIDLIDEIQDSDITGVGLNENRKGAEFLPIIKAKDEENALDLDIKFYNYNCTHFLTVFGIELNHSEQSFTENKENITKVYHQIGGIFTGFSKLLMAPEQDSNENGNHETPAYLKKLAAEITALNKQSLALIPETQATHKELVANYQKLIYYLDLPKDSLSEKTCQNNLQAINARLQQRLVDMTTYKVSLNFLDDLEKHLDVFKVDAVLFDNMTELLRHMRGVDLAIETFLNKGKVLASQLTLSIEKTSAV